MINEQNLERVPGSGESPSDVGRAATQYWLWKVQHTIPTPDHNPGKEATEALLAQLRQQKRANGGK